MAVAALPVFERLPSESEIEAHIDGILDLLSVIDLDDALVEVAKLVQLTELTPFSQLQLKKAHKLLRKYKIDNSFIYECGARWVTFSENPEVKICQRLMVSQSYLHFLLRVDEKAKSEGLPEGQIKVLLEQYSCEMREDFDRMTARRFSRKWREKEIVFDQTFAGSV